MEQEWIRKECLEKIESPEELNKTINITKTPVWIISVAILLFLIVIIIWGNTAIVESRMLLPVTGDIAYLNEADITRVEPGMDVWMGDKQAHVAGIPSEPKCAEDVMTKYQMHVQNLGPDDWVYCLQLDAEAPEDVKNVLIVTEYVHPLSLFNN